MYRYRYGNVAFHRRSNDLITKPGQEEVGARFRMEVSDMVRQSAMQHDQASRKNPKDTELAFGAGVLCLAVGQTQRATHFFDAVLKVEPQHVGANLAVGKMVASAGDNPHKARRYLRKALSKEPRTAGAEVGWLMLGAVECSIADESPACGAAYVEFSSLLY
jgi:Flp pilus assembly protein TadD